MTSNHSNWIADIQRTQFLHKLRCMQALDDWELTSGNRNWKAGWGHIHLIHQPRAPTQTVEQQLSQVYGSHKSTVSPSSKHLAGIETVSVASRWNRVFGVNGIVTTRLGAISVINDNIKLKPSEWQPRSVEKGIRTKLCCGPSVHMCFQSWMWWGGYKSHVGGLNLPEIPQLEHPAFACAFREALDVKDAWQSCLSRGQ